MNSLTKLFLSENGKLKMSLTKMGFKESGLPTGRD